MGNHTKKKHQSMVDRVATVSGSFMMLLLAMEYKCRFTEAMEAVMEPWFAPIFAAALYAVYRWTWKALILLLVLAYATVDSDLLLWRIPDGLDLSGKVIVITGANAGLGLETARQLGALGATVILACRNVSACEKASAGIPHGVAGPRFDLGDPTSIAPFVDWVRTHYGKVDTLVNNAGFIEPAAGDPRSRAPPPFPGKLGSVPPSVGYMHLGHFALTRALVPLLRAADKPRVVNVSSSAAAISFIYGLDPNFEQWNVGPIGPQYPPMVQKWVPFEFTWKEVDPGSEDQVWKYSRAKLAAVLFTHEIPKRYEGIQSTSVLPGLVHTSIGHGYVQEHCHPVLGYPLFTRALCPGVRPILRAVVDHDHGFGSGTGDGTGSSSSNCVGQLTTTSECFPKALTLLNPSWDTAKAAASLWEWSEANV